MFINYFAQPDRSTPINILVFRVFLCAYAIWKLLSYDFDQLSAWPTYLYDQHPYGQMLPLAGWLDWIHVEVWFTFAALVAVMLGWKVRVTGVVAAFLIFHLVALHYVVTNSGTTFLMAAYCLILLALYAENDPLSWDGLARLRAMSSKSVASSLRPLPSSRWSMAPLVWALVFVGASYAITGLCKINKSGFEWAEAGNVALMVQRECHMYLAETPLAARLLLDSPLLLSLSSWSTLVLECGLLVVILLRKPITLFVLGILVLHTMIALSMQILFFDQFLLFALFLPWDRAFGRLAQTAPLSITYDSRCARLARLLNLLKNLDVHQRIQITDHDPQDNKSYRPAVATREVVNSHALPLRVTRVGHETQGLNALREIVEHLGFSKPFVVFRPFARLYSPLSPATWKITDVLTCRLSAYLFDRIATASPKSSYGDPTDQRSAA